MLELANLAYKKCGNYLLRKESIIFHPLTINEKYQSQYLPSSQVNLLGYDLFTSTFHELDHTELQPYPRLFFKNTNRVEHVIFDQTSIGGLITSNIMIHQLDTPSEIYIIKKNNQYYLDPNHQVISINERKIRGKLELQFGDAIIFGNNEMIFID